MCSANVSVARMISGHRVFTCLDEVRRREYTCATLLQRDTVRVVLEGMARQCGSEHTHDWEMGVVLIHLHSVLHCVYVRQ